MIDQENNKSSITLINERVPTVADTSLHLSYMTDNDLLPNLSALAGIENEPKPTMSAKTKDKKTSQDKNKKND